MSKKIRNIGATFVAFIFILSGLTKRARNRAQKGEFILSIYFHSPSKSLFEFCVKWLQRNSFKFLSQQDILAISRQEMPFPKGGVVITVDDGWQSNMENIVEVADKYRIPVTIFVSTSPVEEGNFWWSYISSAQTKKLTHHTIAHLKNVPNREREAVLEKLKRKISLPREALTIAQVREIAHYDFMTIGSHTLTHPILIQCEDEVSYSELKDSKEKLEKWTGKGVYCTAYPNGDYSEREVDHLKNIGYELAYTTEASYLTQERLQELYELPRFCVFENISKTEAVCRILGVWQRFVKSK